MYTLNHRIVTHLYKEWVSLLYPKIPKHFQYSYYLSFSFQIWKLEVYFCLTFFVFENCVVQQLEQYAFSVQYSSMDSSGSTEIVKWNIVLLWNSKKKSICFITWISGKILNIISLWNVELQILISYFGWLEIYTVTIRLCHMKWPNVWYQQII